MILISRLLRLAVSLTMLHFTPTAEAQGRPECGARDQVVARLATQFDETPRGAGLRGSDRMVELFASKRTGSWTLLLTAPDGTTCLLAAGQHWQGEDKASVVGKAL